MDISGNVLAVMLALIASLLSPVVLLVLQGRDRRADREQQYKREDEVAKNAADAAKELLTATKQQTAKLEVIHKLVNSNLTEAKQAQFNALELHAESLLREMGKDPQNDALPEMYASIKNKIKNLGAELVMRRAHDAAQLLATTAADPIPTVAAPVRVIPTDSSEKPTAAVVEKPADDMPTVVAPVRVIDSGSDEIATADVVKKP